MNIREKKIIILVGTILLTVCLMFGIIYLVRYMNYKNEVESLTYTDIVIGDISDGTYVGECNVDFIYAKVAVTVEGGVLTKLELLEHRQERGTSAEQILDDMVRLQSFDVDAVSGATNSCKVIRKAIENAIL